MVLITKFKISNTPSFELRFNLPVFEDMHLSQMKVQCRFVIRVQVLCSIHCLSHKSDVTHAWRPKLRFQRSTYHIWSKEPELLLCCGQCIMHSAGDMCSLLVYETVTSHGNSTHRCISRCREQPFHQLTLTAEMHAGKHNAYRSYDLCIDGAGSMKCVRSFSWRTIYQWLSWFIIKLKT